MMHKQSNNLSFKLKMVLGVLVITIVTGMGTIAYTASAASTNNQNGQISYFDPFEMTTIYLNVPENGLNAAVYGGIGIPPQANIAANSDATASSGVIRRSPIRVPYRPPFRSPFRPPWVPGPPSWYPGDPPWTPGPPPWNPNS